MTMTFSVNPATNDLTIKDGRLLLTYGADEVRQRILITLKHLWGEYFLNVPAGVPWNELILGGKDTATISALLRQIVFSVPGVRSIISFNMIRPNGRDWVISMSVEVDGVDGVQEAIEVVYP